MKFNNRAGETDFYATFERLAAGQLRSVMKMITPFDMSDDQKKVEFYLNPAYPSGTTQNFDKTITVKGICNTALLKTFLNLHI